MITKPSSGKQDTKHELTDTKKYNRVDAKVIYNERNDNVWIINKKGTILKRSPALSYVSGPYGVISTHT